MKTPRLSNHPHTPARHAFSLAGVCAITLASVGMLIGAALYARTYLVSNDMAAVVSAVLVDLTNEDRQDEGLGGLTINPHLVAAAQAKANDMAEKGYFAHTSPDGTTSWHWFRAAGYAYAYAGENLAVDFSDSEDVARAWMDSPTHRANVLGEHYTEIGIASAVGTYQGHTATFVVQMFGRPTQAHAAAQVTAPASVDRFVKPVESSRVLGTETGGEAAVALEEVAPVPSTAAATMSDEIAAEVTRATEVPVYAPVWGTLVTSPKTLLQTIYLVSAFLLLLALAHTTRLEFKKHHVRHVVAAALLLLVLGGLFYATGALVFSEPVLASGSDILDTRT